LRVSQNGRIDSLIPFAAPGALRAEAAEIGRLSIGTLLVASVAAAFAISGAAETVTGVLEITGSRPGAVAVTTMVWAPDSIPSGTAVARLNVPSTPTTVEPSVIGVEWISASMVVPGGRFALEIENGSPGRKEPSNPPSTTVTPRGPSGVGVGVGDGVGVGVGVGSSGNGGVEPGVGAGAGGVAVGAPITVTLIDRSRAIRPPSLFAASLTV